MSTQSDDLRLRRLAAVGLVIGALLGMAGAFAPSASLRGLLWGVDGTALVVACALLTVHHLRRGHDLAAGGFLVFVAGEAAILSSAVLSPDAAAPFTAGVSLWAASLVLVGVSSIMPRLVTGVGFVAALLFAIVAVRLFLGEALTPLAEPLPAFAYPFFAVTLLGWAWVHFRGAA